MENIILAIICIAAGTAFLINARKFQYHIKNVLRNGKETYGEVKSVSTAVRGTSFVKIPVVEYDADGQKKIIDDFWVSQNKNIYSGQPLIVIYNPRNEKEYLIKETVDSKDYLNVKGAVGGAYGIMWAIAAYALAAAEIIFFFIG